MITQTAEILKVARAGALAVFNFSGGAQINANKAGGELVSAYDLSASDAMNTEWENTELAGIPVIDEERPDTHKLLDRRDKQQVGMLDPIDGTAVFLRTLLAPEGSIQSWHGATIALIRDGVVSHAAMTLLGHRMIFCGERGGRCYWIAGNDFEELLTSGTIKDDYPIIETPDDDDRGHPLNIAISASSKMSEQLFDHHEYLLRCIRTAGLLGNELAMGCAVGNVIAVMKGHADFYVNAGSGVAWDLAGPLLLAELAGCVCTTIKGDEIVWGSKPQSVICARNRSVYRRVLAAVNPL